MRNIYILLTSLFLSLNSFAQQNTTSQLFKSLETPDASTGSKVTVINHVLIDLIGKENQVEGYRIRLFFDNTQNARTEAELEELRYSEIYPQDSTYIEYFAPYFKLTAGNYLDHQEALVKWSEIVKKFDNAFIVKERINIEVFKLSPRDPLEPIDLQDPLFIDSLSVNNPQVKITENMSN